MEEGNGRAQKYLSLPHSEPALAHANVNTLLMNKGLRKGHLPFSLPCH